MKAIKGENIWGGEYFLQALYMHGLADNISLLLFRVVYSNCSNIT